MADILRFGALPGIWRYLPAEGKQLAKILVY